MLIIVDRFEGDYAVLLEENQTRDVPKQALAADIREGDVVLNTVNILHSNKLEVIYFIRQISPL